MSTVYTTNYDDREEIVAFDTATGARAPADDGAKPQGYVQHFDGDGVIAIYVQDGKLYVWIARPHELTDDVTIEHTEGELGNPRKLAVKRRGQIVAETSYPDPREGVPLVDIAFGWDAETELDLGRLIARISADPSSRAYAISGRRWS